jgi:hypothetical protein
MIETRMLQFSRSMFAMARDKMLHPRYAKRHPEWQISGGVIFEFDSRYRFLDLLLHGSGS